MNSLLNQYQHICNLLNEFSVKLETGLLGMGPLSTNAHKQPESLPSAFSVLENQSIGCDEVLELIQLQITYSNIRNEAIYSIANNVEQPKTRLDAGLIVRFEALARQNGVDEIEFVEVAKSINFAKSTYVFTMACILSLKNESNNYLSNDFFLMQSNHLKMLCQLGDTGNNLAHFLREQGYAVFVEHGSDVVGNLNHTGQRSFQENSAFRIPNVYRIVLYTSINSFV